MHPEHAQADQLSEQVQAARTRMLYSHIPMATSIGTSLGLTIALMVAYLVPAQMGRLGWGWVICFSLAAAAHLRQSLLFFRSRDRARRSWLIGVQLTTFVLSAMWGTMLWALPISTHVEMQAALVGSVTGLAACGAFMFSGDRDSARLWLVPMLLMTIIYCAAQRSVLGLFGCLTLSGFLIVLWIETGRAHRRIGELLYLRFINDRITSSQAVALREAEALSQAKGLFLATMSHEMRTPLHGILGLSRLIRGELQTQEAHERMNLLEGAGEHLLGVINDVLDYSRLQAGRLELSRNTVNLSELAREVTALAAVNGLDKGLDVTQASSLPADCFVEADGVRLKQILHNLLGNAVKFTERGRVTLRLSPLKQGDAGETTGVCFEVQDTGIGIPPHELGRVFDAFHQVDGGYERRTPGSGLGLSIAREICLAMGGELSCESEQGRGSLFRLTLPLRPLPPSSQPMEVPLRASMATGMARPAVAEAEKATVLLVEDNLVNAIVARTELEQMGLHVALAENGQLALDWLAEHRADLVLMDCHMPEMNGFDAARHIRAIESQRGEPPVPIVALTASTQQEVQQACLQAGMNECLSKPFLRGDLLKVVRRHVKGAARQALKPQAAVDLVIT